MPVPRAAPDQALPAPAKELLLGDDWVRPDDMADAARRGGGPGRSRLALFRSPLARKIALFNLSALIVLLAGLLLSDPFRDTLVVQRQQGIVTEARLVAAVFEARGIAPTEDIRSVRFDGTRAFIVTFKKTDPLFASLRGDARFKQGVLDFLTQRV